MIIFRLSYIKVLLIATLVTLSFSSAQSQTKGESTETEHAAPPPPPDDGGGGDGGGSTKPPSAPPNPTASTNYCGNKTLTRSGTPPAGIKWYWQTSSSGTSKTHETASYTARSSGTYYLRAFDFGSNLWSTFSGSVTVTVRANPSAPSVPTLEGCNNDILRRGTPPSGVTWYWQGTNSSGTSQADASATYRATTTGTYYLRSRTSSCWGSSVSKYVVVAPSPGEVSVNNTKRFGEGYLNLTASTPNAVKYNWYSSATATTPLASVDKSWKNIFSQSATYYVAGVGSNGCDGPRTPVQVVIYERPKVLPVGNSTLDLAQTTVTLTTNQSFDTYQWYDQYGPIEGEESRTLEVTKEGHYAVKVTRAGVSGYDISDYYLVRHALEEENRSYKYTVTIKKEGIKNEAEVMALPAGDKVESLVFYDGMGRPEQAIYYGENDNHIVKTYEYDASGRETTSWLPYVTDTRPEKFVTDWKSKVEQYYQGQTNSPFVRKNVDNSPRSVLRESGFVGDDWQPGSDNTLKYSYTFTDGSEGLFRFTVDGGLVLFNTYGAGELHKVAVYDEEGHRYFRFDDAEGHTVLTRKPVGEPSSETWADTYYVYDRYGNLRYVLPPEAVKEIGTPAAPFTPSQDLLDRWAFQYKYDHLDRPAEARVPGADWVYLVYDDRDRVVLSQDGNQRKAGVWTFAKYDVYDRPIATGKYVPGSTMDQSAMQGHVDAHYQQAPRSTRHEEFDAGSGLHGYTDRSFPTGIAADDYYTVNYYDDYGFKALPGFGPGYDYDPGQLGTESCAQGEYTYPTLANNQVKGLLTGSKTQLMDGAGTWLHSTIYYDDQYRAIQSVADNHVGKERRSSLYSFAGLVLATYTSYEENNDVVGIKRRYTYDYSGRLVQGYHELYTNGAGQGEVLLAENKYNELGELEEKNLHVEGGISRQSIDYRYNIRGWLKSINSSHLDLVTGQNENDDHKDLFGMELYHNEPLILNNQSSNGAPQE